MPWRGPSFPGEFPSLGWIVLEQMALLPSPLDESKPLIATDEQAETIVRWYRIDPETGRFPFRRGCSCRSKGYGKSPIEGAKAVVEFAGECKFDGWDANGEPVARPWGTGGLPMPWVQIAAVAEAQTENTYGALYAMLTANDGRAAAAFGIDEGRTRLYLRSRPGRMEPVTARAGTREGQPVTYAAMDETMLWTPQLGGPALARTLRRNVGKMDGRSYENTNAPVPGESSVAESTIAAASAPGSEVFLDMVSAPEVKETDPDRVLLKALDRCYGGKRGSWWVSRERQLQEIRDPDTPWDEALRFYFTVSASRENQWCDIAAWDRRARELDADGLPVHTPRPPDGLRVVLGFDGSWGTADERIPDSTALRGAVLEDGDWSGHVFTLGIWEADGDSDWEPPFDEVDVAVAEAFDSFDVWRSYCDPAYWRDWINLWKSRHGDDRVHEFHTNRDRQMAAALEALHGAIHGPTDELTHDGDPRARDHFSNARKMVKRPRSLSDDPDGKKELVLVRKVTPRSAQKIDTVLADALAWWGRGVGIAAGENVVRRKTKAYGF